MAAKLRVLVVDDDSTFCLMLTTYLQKHDYEVDGVFSYSEASNAIRSKTYDVVLTDYRLPEKCGMDVLNEAKRANSQTVVIIMTGYADIKLAVTAIKQGAYDYVAKPFNPDEILATIQNALASRKTQGKPLRNPATFRFIEGESVQSQKVSQFIKVVAPTNLSVVIEGDSGTGKEYVARQIHALSRRSANPFVAIDCGALPKDLAASEFFGHIKGAFTGAVAGKIGQFEVANGGTLFLDEIGNLPYGVQGNLLRAIQERKIKNVGGNKEISVDVRIIVASNENLLQMVNRGTFREDLFHRLNEFTIRVAPLRERPDDLMIFANNFLQMANIELGKTVNGFSNDVNKVLRKYAWPGNLRELKNIIRRAVLLEQTQQITTQSLPYEIIESQADNDELIANNEHDNLKKMKERAEYELIISTLEKVQYNKSKAAKILEIDRKTLYNKMKQYGIEY